MTFPDADTTTGKLAAPMKKSIFERQKAEAEAKKAREKAENAAALEDFVKSFEDDGADGFPTRRGGEGARGGGFGSGAAGHSGGPGKRHFTASGLKSGPGSLGPMPGAFGKKRHYDEYRDRDRDNERRDRMFSYGGTGDSKAGGNRRESGAFSREEDEDIKDAEELKAAAKPTLYLSSLPPGMSPAVIKGLFAPSPLTVDDVRILPPTNPQSSSAAATDRKSVSAIITLAAETPATDIDTMVSHLQNKYLGYGFHLSISRHLSSAALTGAGSLSNNAPHVSSTLQNLPFGAKPIPQHQQHSMSRAPPPGPGRFAPPASYTSSTPYSSAGPRSATQVTVHIPHDLAQLRLIHKTIEALLTYGPEFEALLMSRPQIQRDEKWAWLWDARSLGGVYYRWRLWEILTDARSQRGRGAGMYGGQGTVDFLFQGQAPWIAPVEDLKFEYTTQIDEFISDEDYNSSDEEDIDLDDAKGGGGLAGRYRDHQRVTVHDAPETDHNDGHGYLNPLAKTKLVHLLSRLPETNARLRKGDVARVTGFAIEHAGAGADEVAELMTRNVVRPFRFTVKKASGGEDEARENEDDDNLDDDDENGHVTLPTTQNPGPSNSKGGDPKDKDTSPSSLIALYILSDLLSASSTSGVRHAWRYRSLVLSHLLRQKTFLHLGRLPRMHTWGKLRAEKWRRQVQVVLDLWEGWSVFEEKGLRECESSFFDALEGRDEKDEKGEEKENSGAVIKNASVNKWKSLGDAAAASTTTLPAATPAADADGDTEMKLDGTPMADDDDDDEDGETVLTDENLDGMPMFDSSEEDEPEEAKEPEPADGSAAQLQPMTQMLTKSGQDDLTTEAQKDKAGDSAASGQRSSTSVGAPAAGVQAGRRARPRAADFDDMFE